MSTRKSRAARELRERIDRLGGKKRTQKQLAKILGGKTTAAVSAFRLGSLKPSTKILIKLANWATGLDILWFLEKAGVDIRKLLPLAQHLALASLPEAKSDELVFIPPLDISKRSEDGGIAGFPIPRRFTLGLKDAACLVIGEKSAGYGLDPGDVVVLETNISTPSEGLMPILGSRILVEIDFSVLYPGLKVESATPKQFLPGRIFLSEGIPSEGTVSYTALFRPWADEMVATGSGERTVVPPAPLVVGKWSHESKAQTGPGSKRGPRADEFFNQALTELQLYPGVRVVGKLIAWYHPPRDASTHAPGRR